MIAASASTTGKQIRANCVRSLRIASCPEKTSGATTALALPSGPQPPQARPACLAASIARRHIPHEYGFTTICGCGSDLATIGAEGQVAHDAGVSLENDPHFPGFHVPHPDLPKRAKRARPGDNVPSVRCER